MLNGSSSPSYLQFLLLRFTQGSQIRRASLHLSRLGSDFWSETPQMSRGGGSKSKLHCTIHQLSRGESEAKLPTKTEQPSTWVNWRKVLQDYFWSRPAARNKQKYLSSCCWTCKGVSRLQDMSNSQISLWNVISQQWQAGLLTRRQLAIS